MSAAGTWTRVWRPGVTAVVRHNGAGKYASLKLRQDSAARLGLRADRLDTSSTTPPPSCRAAAWRRHGFPGAARIFTPVSVLSNVAFPLRDRDRASWCAPPSVARRGYRRPCPACLDCPGGQAARVAIARALCSARCAHPRQASRVCLGGGLRPGLAVLRGLAGAGITTLLISHDIAKSWPSLPRGRHGRTSSRRANPPASPPAHVGVHSPPGRAQRHHRPRRCPPASSSACARRQGRCGRLDNTSRRIACAHARAVALSRERIHASPRSVCSVVAGIGDVDGSLVRARQAISDRQGHGVAWADWASASVIPIRRASKRRSVQSRRRPCVKGRVATGLVTRQRIVDGCPDLRELNGAQC